MAQSVETLTLYTQQATDLIVPPEAKEAGWPGTIAQTVTAVESSHAGYLEIGRPLEVEEDVREWHLSLPLPIARRFCEFYGRAMTSRRPPRLECHSLPLHLWGKGKRIPMGVERMPRRIHVHVPGAHHPHDLEAGQPYIMTTPKWEVQHSFLAFGPEHPSHNVSVLGVAGSIAVTATAQLMTTYGANAVRQFPFPRHYSIH